MAHANLYNPNHDFSGDVANNADINADALDSEFQKIGESINKSINNQKLIQRDDGKLKDKIIDVNNLTRSVLNLLGNYRLRGIWESSENYLIGDVVERNDKLYVCDIANSDVNFSDDQWKHFGYADDLEAGYYAEIAKEAAENAALALSQIQNFDIAVKLAQAIAAKEASEIARDGASSARYAAIAAKDALFNDLSSPGDAKGDALISVKQPFTGAAARTQHDKNTDYASVNDFFAAENTNSTLTFELIESSDIEQKIDLLGKTWACDFLPVKKKYFNGAFEVDGVEIEKPEYLTSLDSLKYPIRSARKVLAIGDSLTEKRNGTSYIDFLAQSLNSLYGGAKEIGYIPFASYSTKWLFGVGINVTWAGFSEMYDATDFGNFGIYPDKYSPDGKGLKLPSAAGTENISLSISTLAYTEIKLAYLATPDGGNFTFKFTATESQDIQTFSTYSTTTEIKYLTIPARAAEGMGFTISGFVAGKEYNFFGCELINTDRTGFAISDYSRNGVKLSDFMDLDQSALAKHVFELNPTIILLNIGTNDATGGTSASVFESNLTNYVNLLIANAPNAQVIIIEPTDHIMYRNSGALYPSYTVARKKVAKNLAVGYVNLPLLVGDYDEWRTANLYETIDFIHPTGVGKRIVANALLNSLSINSVNNEVSYPTVAAPTHIFLINEKKSTTTVSSGTTQTILEFGLNKSTRGMLELEIVTMNSTESCIKTKVFCMCKKTSSNTSGGLTTVSDVVVVQDYKTGAVAFSNAINVAVVNNKGVVTVTPTGWNYNAAILSGKFTAQSAHPKGSLIKEYL